MLGLVVALGAPACGGGSDGSRGATESGGSGGAAGREGAAGMPSTGGAPSGAAGAAGMAGMAGASPIAPSTWAGLWDGMSVRTSGGASEPVPFLVLVDAESRVFLADSSREAQGWGTLTGSGEIAFEVDGALVGDGGSLTYVGVLTGNTGSGTWTSSSGATGTWSITRRVDVDVTSSCAAQCDALGPCMAAPDTAPELAVGGCAFVCALPSPAEEVLLARFGECDLTGGCAAMAACYAAGTVETAYVAPTGDDTNDGATPATAKRTLNAAAAVVTVDGTIRVAEGTYEENVVLTKPLTLEGGYDEAFATADPALYPVVIDGRERDRVVTVLSPGHGSGRLVLRGLSLVRGATADGGGAVAPSGLVELVLEDCVLTDNAANDDGGGIAASDVTLTVTGCTLERNTSAGNAGGAIAASRSTVTLTDTVLRDNVAANYGGGFNAWESEATVTGCEITGNTADVAGGGVCFSPGTASSYALGSSTVTGNAPDDVGCGPYTDLGGNTVGSP